MTTEPDGKQAGDLPADVAALIEHLASAAGAARQDVVAEALALSANYRAAQMAGGHLGVVTDATRLDAELLASGGLVTDLVRRLKPDEHDDDRRVRLRAEQRGALLDDIKGLVLFVALLLGVFGVAIICVWFALFAANVSSETQRWAQTMLAAIVSGGISFLVGRKIGGK